MVDWQNMFAERVAGMRASEIRDAFRLTECPDIISFAGGFPSPQAFPVAQLQEGLQRILAHESPIALQYGPTDGLYELRRLVATRMCREGVAATPENVLITNGSQQALDLICKLFVDPDDPMLVELPAYIGGLNAFLNYQARFIGIPLDDAGLNMEALAGRLAELRAGGGKMPRLIYVVPNFQNPTGVTLSLLRRQRLLELAGEYNFLVIEDNPYGSLRFEGEILPHIKTFDTEGRVLYLGSFSKVFLPGIRLGWVVAPEAVIQKLVVAKQGTDLCSNSLGQKMVCEFLGQNDFETHLQELRSLYKRRRNLALAAMQEHFPAGVRWTVPEGGFFIFVTLPECMDAKALLPLAVAEERVAYVPGGAFYVDGTGQNTIRIAYSQAAEADLVEGLTRLGRFLRNVAARQEQTAGAPQCVYAASAVGSRS